MAIKVLPAERVAFDFLVMDAILGTVSYLALSAEGKRTLYSVDSSGADLRLVENFH